MTNKTLDQLTSITAPAGTDVLPILHPATAVLQNITWSNIVAALTGTFTQKANNLSDVADATTARTNLGLGTAATANTGTAAGTVPVQTATSTLAVNVGGNAATATTATTANGLAAGVAVANIGYTPVNKAGDTMSGSLNVVGAVSAGVANSISFNSSASVSNLWADFAGGSRISYDRTNGKWTIYSNSVAIASVDVNGNAVFKGTVTPSGSP